MTMKKFLLTLVCIAGVVISALLIWKFVIPFLGIGFSWMLPG